MLKKRSNFVLLAALSLTAIIREAQLAAAQAQPELPRVLVLATGGTIAGEGEPGTLGNYEIRKPVTEIIAQVPELKKYAQVETEQFSNVPSSLITPDQWLTLSRRINAVLEKKSDLTGIVITHGTDRLDETAFFLHLTIRSDRPVVLVGAQRPPTAISPDGPINLLSAVRVAASPESRGKGVLVVMDDRVISARDAQKFSARNGGFSAQEMGVIGLIARHDVEYFYTPVRRHTAASEFDVRDLTSLPRVDIQYSYAGAEGGGKTDAKAIIVATTGLSPIERTYYDGLQRRGVVVATTFPSGAQVTSPASSRDPSPMIGAQRMPPTHARILMMLALTKTQDPREIQRFFDQY